MKKQPYTFKFLGLSFFVVLVVSTFNCVNLFIGVDLELNNGISKAQSNEHLPGCSFFPYAKPRHYGIPELRESFSNAKKKYPFLVDTW